MAGNRDTDMCRRKCCNAHGGAVQDVRQHENRKQRIKFDHNPNTVDGANPGWRQYFYHQWALERVRKTLPSGWESCFLADLIARFVSIPH